MSTERVLFTALVFVYFLDIIVRKGTGVEPVYTPTLTEQAIGEGGYLALTLDMFKPRDIIKALECKMFDRNRIVKDGPRFCIVLPSSG